MDSTNLLQQIVDTTQLDSLQQIVEQETSLNIWMYVAILEFILLVYLFIKEGKYKHKNSQSELKSKVLNEGPIDFNNIINSAFHSDELYRNLIRKCHPDRFEPDKDKVNIANDLTMRITKNKNNIKELQQLKAEAEQKLQIKL